MRSVFLLLLVASCLAVNFKGIDANKDKHISSVELIDHLIAARDKDMPEFDKELEKYFGKCTNQ